MQKTNFPFEIIINDDASTDGTTDIIRDYHSKFPDLFVPVYHEENEYSRGVRGIMARNTFPIARGKYLALCEGDDFWTDPLKLQRQVDFLENNSGYSLSTENSMFVNHLNKTEYLFSNDSDRDIEIVELLTSRKFHTASVVMKKELLELQDYFITPVGDTYLFIALAKKGKVHFKNIVSSVYNRHEKSVTEMDKTGWPYKIEKSNLLIDKFTSFKYSTILKTNIARAFFSSFKYNLKRGKIKEAALSILKVFKYNYRVLLKLR